MGAFSSSDRVIYLGYFSFVTVILSLLANLRNKSVELFII